MTTRIRAALAFAIASHVVSLMTLTAAPMVEEKIIGPTNAGGIYTFSPQGGRVAYLGLKGSQGYVVVDGGEGPLFDELLAIRGQSFFAPQKAGAVLSDAGGMAGATTSTVILSPDGAHYAYAARQGGNYLVVHDGKIVGKGPMETLALAAGPLTLSPTGKQVYWHEVQELQGGQHQWRVVMSGKPAAWSGQQTMLPVFNADDSRYAVVGGKVGSYQTPILIVDGKEAAYAGLKPVFTADGSALISFVRDGNKTALLVNGKSVADVIEVEKIVAAPVGRRWAAIARTKFINNIAVPSLFIDGKEIAGTEGAQNVWFSPDGKRYAATVVHPTSKAGVVLVDGKRGKEYPNVPMDRVYWSPDNTRCLYFVAAAGRTFVVVDGEEQAVNRMLGYNPIVMPESGSTYGYATADNMNQNYTLVLNGQNVLPATVYPLADTLAFSANGKSHGYVVATIGRSDASGIVINGEMRRDVAPRPFSKWYQMQVSTPSIVFSPDGSHHAYLAQGGDRSSSGLYVDGKLAYRTTAALYFPTFTPDGKHLYWVAQVPAKVPGQPTPLVVYVDGVEAVRAHGLFLSNAPGVFSLDAKGTATFYAADGDVAKRYRITPASDTTVVSAIEQLAKADAVALAAAAEAQKKADAEAAAAAEEKAAAAAKAKADYEAAVEAKKKARLDALEARKKAAEEAAAAKARAREDARARR